MHSTNVCISRLVKKGRFQCFAGTYAYFPPIGVDRIFDWGGPKPQITCNDVVRNFQKRMFLLGKDIVEWKI